MTLAPVFLGSLARRRLATPCPRAIVLGVALGMAVQAVHQAALANSTAACAPWPAPPTCRWSGRAAVSTKQLYAVLAARPEVAAASPLLEVEAKLVGREESLQLFGVDVFTLAAVSRPCCPACRIGRAFRGAGRRRPVSRTAAQEAIRA
jgi:putative ABC transport system permease protein